MSQAWIPVRLKFFKFSEGFGYLVPVDPNLRDIFVHAEEFKSAGIIWMPQSKVIFAQYTADAKGLRCTKLSYMKPKELEDEQSHPPAEPPARSHIHLPTREA